MQTPKVIHLLRTCLHSAPLGRPFGLDVSAGFAVHQLRALATRMASHVVEEWWRSWSVYGTDRRMCTSEKACRIREQANEEFGRKISTQEALILAREVAHILGKLAILSARGLQDKRQRSASCNTLEACREQACIPRAVAVPPATRRPWHQPKRHVSNCSAMPPPARAAPPSVMRMQVPRSSCS